MIGVCVCDGLERDANSDWRLDSSPAASRMADSDGTSLEGRRSPMNLSAARVSSSMPGAWTWLYADVASLPAYFRITVTKLERIKNITEINKQANHVP